MCSCRLDKSQEEGEGGKSDMINSFFDKHEDKEEEEVLEEEEDWK